MITATAGTSTKIAVRVRLPEEVSEVWDDGIYQRNESDKASPEALLKNLLLLPVSHYL